MMQIITMAEADAVPDLSKVVCMFCLNAEGLQDPKSLPCSHIYCLKCVTRYYEVNGIIRCPLCRENFAETPESLPTAYQVAVVDSSILCDVCTTKGLEKNPAVAYCTQCFKLFCAKHQHSHDDTLEEHSRININVYKRQAEKLQPRMCSQHKDFPYSMGCRTCLTALCNKCISGGGACTGGSAHQLLTLDELVTELTTVDQIQDKEDKLDDLFKLMSNIIADFDTETDSLLMMLHKQRDEQLEAIGLKYQKLEEELLELRAKTKSDMVEFMEGNVSVKLSDLYITRMNIKALRAHSHQCHDDTLEEHSRININVYKRQAEKLHPRMCSQHGDFPYGVGCRTCLTALCNKCISGGGACTGGLAHQLLTLDELVTELTSVDKIQDKEDKLEDLFKLMSNIIAEFDTETDSLLMMLHKLRDEQLEAIGLKYQKLEKELLEHRAKTKSDMVEFMEENVGVKLSDLYLNRMKIESLLAHSHQVDIVDGYAKIKDQIQKLLSDVIPELEFPHMNTLEVKEEKRDVEIEVVSAGSGRVSLEQGLVITPPPPKSMKLVHTVELAGNCYCACEHKGITYVGVWGGVHTIDENYKVTKSFITLREYVESITVYKDRLYLLVVSMATRFVNVHQLSGEYVTRWSHTDVLNFFGLNGNQLAVIDDQIVIPDRKNKKITSYSLAGEVVKSVPCPLVTGTYTAICAADTQSVIITNSDSSQVFKVDLVTGEVLWSSTSVPKPQGVTCYRGDYVLLVASRSTTPTICVLEVKTGKLLTTITDPTVGEVSNVLNLHITGNTLIVPSSEQKVLFYQLV